MLYRRRSLLTLEVRTVSSLRHRRPRKLEEAHNPTEAPLDGPTDHVCALWFRKTTVIEPVGGG
jgi:hypothetical protein